LAIIVEEFGDYSSFACFSEGSDLLYLGKRSPNNGRALETRFSSPLTRQTGPEKMHGKCGLHHDLRAKTSALNKHLSLRE
jgi:hypothetical protein